MGWDMKQQQGAALVVVLSMLTMSLMLGLSGMQSSLVEERLSGNYKAATEAQMAAEQAISEAWDVLDQSMLDGAEDATIEAVEGMGFSDFSSSPGVGSVCDGGVVCYYRVIEDGGYYIVGLGAVLGAGGEVISVSDYVFAEVISGDSGTPFEDAVTGCEGVSLGGGPQIDSFNSNYGAYGESVTVDGETFVNSLRSEAVVRTVSDGAGLDLSGNAPVYGDVYVTGDLSLKSGTPIHGNVYSDGSVNMNGSIYGDLFSAGSIDFGTSSMIEGDAVTEGSVVVGATGNPPSYISANGSVSYPDWWKWDDDKVALAENYHEGQSNDVPQVYDSEESCDELGVVDENGSPGKLFGSIWENPSLQDISDWFDDNLCGHCYSLNGGRFSFSGGTGNNDASTTVVGKDGEESFLRVDSDVTTGGRLSELQVRGDVTLIVDGDFDLGNNTVLSVADGSTLSLYVTGKTRLGGGSSLLSGDGFVRGNEDGEKKPAVMLYSAYDQFGGNPNSAGITMSGANDSYISVYAPNTDTVITGSGSLYGAIRSGYIDMRGSGDIHYDEALKEVSLGEGGDGGSDPSIVSWR